MLSSFFAWFIVRGGFILYPIALLAVFRFGWAMILPLLLLPIVGVLPGALGGATYSLLLPLRRLGAVGRWLSWTIAGGVYLFPILMLVGPLHDPPIHMADPAARIAWLLGSLWCGSLGYWGFGSDEDPNSGESNAPTVRGILSEAVRADLDELRAASGDDPSKQVELREIQTRLS